MRLSKMPAEKSSGGGAVRLPRLRRRGAWTRGSFASPDLSMAVALLAFYAVNGLFGLESVRIVAFAVPWRSLAPTALAVFPALLLWQGADSTLVVGAAAVAFALGFVVLPRLIPRPEPELDGVSGEVIAERASDRPLSLVAWVSVRGRDVTTLLRSTDSHIIARELAADPRWGVTRVDRVHLLVFGPPPVSWSRQTAGLAEQAFSAEPGSPVQGVLTLAEKHRCLRALARQLKTPICAPLHLAERLRASCESVAVLSPDKGALPGEDCAEVLREARRSAFVSSVRRGPNEAGALWEGGRMKLVAVVPRAADPTARAAIRELLLAQSVARAALDQAAAG